MKEAVKIKNVKQRQETRGFFFRLYKPNALSALVQDPKKRTSFPNGIAEALWSAFCGGAPPIAELTRSERSATQTRTRHSSAEKAQPCPLESFPNLFTTKYKK